MKLFQEGILCNMGTFGDGISWDFHVGQVLDDEKRGISLHHNISNSELKEAVLYIDTDTPLSDRKMIDCGCHVGRWIDTVRNYGLEYTGIDQSLEAIKVAQLRRPDAKFHNSMLWEMDFDIQYDFAMCIAVLQHNKLEEQDRIIPCIFKALKPGGIFFFAENTLRENTSTQRTHDGWISMAEKFGFKFVKSLHANELGLEDFYIVKKGK